MSALRILDARAVREALPMARAISCMREAFRAVSSRAVEAPQRPILPVGDSGEVLVMPAAARREDGAPALAVKLVSVYPRNREQGRPLIHSVAVLLDAETGCWCGLLEGAALTAIRTGAASGLATELLAAPDAEVAAVIGTGVQARTQLEAIACVRRLREVRVWSPNARHRLDFVREVRGRTPIPERILAADSAAEAVRGAHIIATATTAPRPVLKDADLAPGTHINAVGSYHKDRREIPGETVGRARVVVDSREAAKEEAGDIVLALEEGYLAGWESVTELGEILLGRAPGRRSPEEITLFKSVGTAAQDVVAASEAFEEACRRGLGRTLVLAGP